MSLQTRSLILVIAFFIGANSFVLDASLRSLWGIPGPIWSFAYLALYIFVSRSVLRCPHCGKWAVLRPSGMASPFVGMKCAYCGNDY